MVERSGHGGKTREACFPVVTRTTSQSPQNPANPAKRAVMLAKEANPLYNSIITLPGAVTTIRWIRALWNKRERSRSQEGLNDRNGCLLTQNRKEHCCGKSNFNRRPPDRTSSCRTLCRIFEKKSGASEFRRVQRHLYHDR